MGSYSASCNFSGIEIGEGEVAYIMLLSRDGGAERVWGRHEPKTTLIRGLYNDYGYLKIEDDQSIVDLFNKQSGLSLSNGGDFSLEDLDGIPLDRFWIRGDVLDGLGDLKQDFPYFWTKAASKSVKVKNITGATQLRMDELRTGFEAAVIAWKEAQTLLQGADEELREAYSCLNRFSMSDLFNYGDRQPNYCVELQEAAKDDRSPDAVIEAYRRNFVLTYAGGELRKCLTPSESDGPQHGGEEASVKFARQIIAIQAKRKTRWDS